MFSTPSFSESTSTAHTAAATHSLSPYVETYFCYHCRGNLEQWKHLHSIHASVFTAQSYTITNPAAADSP